MDDCLYVDKVTLPNVGEVSDDNLSPISPRHSNISACVPNHSTASIPKATHISGPSFRYGTESLYEWVSMILQPDHYRIEDHPPIFRFAHDDAIDVSVIIVNYNTRDITTQAVGSVLACAGSVRLEVIVIDNASSDDSVSALRAAYPHVKVIEAGGNGGYARGNNIGISEARGRYILVLNPDALVHPETLEKAIAYMEVHPEVGILGARALYETGAQQSTLFRAIQLSHLLWRIFIPNRLIRETRLFGDQRYASKGRNSELDVDVVAGCFMLLPRRVISEIGAMDDRFFMYSEETEWCWRVRQAGYIVRYHPDVSITHYGAVSTGQTSPWKSVEIAKGQILFLRFTRSPAIAWLGTAIMFLGEILRGFWVVPVNISRFQGQAMKIWAARLRFLARALIVQPKGQAPLAAVQPQTMASLI